MRKIGITGGVGSGKSRVLEYLEDIPGVAVYQADLIARQLQMPGQKCYEAIAEYFGTEILAEDQTIDRKRLGELVFQDRAKLQILNNMVHPSVNQRIKELIQEEDKKGTRIFFLEAALLTDAFYRQILDEIWYIYTEEPVRRERLKTSRHYTEEKITSMINSQPSEEMFRTFCDKILDNTGDFEKTIKQIDDLLQSSGKQE